ncbi:MAG: hypothetical protein MZV65_38280 [Chromatiales bacterium]|nr:hypothetical protein [Chromatiales bacterium]
MEREKVGQRAEKVGVLKEGRDRVFDFEGQEPKERKQPVQVDGEGPRERRRDHPPLARLDGRGGFRTLPDYPHDEEQERGRHRHNEGGLVDGERGCERQAEEGEVEVFFYRAAGQEQRERDQKEVEQEGAGDHAEASEERVFGQPEQAGPEGGGGDGRPARQPHLEQGVVQQDRHDEETEDETGLDDPRQIGARKQDRGHLHRQRGVENEVERVAGHEVRVVAPAPAVAALELARGMGQ